MPSGTKEQDRQCSSGASMDFSLSCEFACQVLLQQGGSHDASCISAKVSFDHILSLLCVRARALADQTSESTMSSVSLGVQALRFSNRAASFCME